MPRITVLLPIYNAERFLAEAIRSVLCQTFDDFELLLLDDGSSDGSADIAHDAAAKDSRIVVVDGTHQGYVYWLNTGLNMARGELIARMDADDICLQSRFAKQVRFLDAHPECCVVGTQAIRIDSEGATINRWLVPERHDDIDELFMRGRTGMIIHPSAMLRRAPLLQVGGYRSGFELAEDYDLFLRLAEVGQLANLPDVLLQYRVHLKCVSLTYTEAQSRRARQALKEAWTRRNKTGPLPPESHDPRTASEEELVWSWALASFAARNFHTARKHALKLLRRRPLELRRWALLGGTCLGPLAKQIMRVCPYRVGPYVPTTNTNRPE